MTDFYDEHNSAEDAINQMQRYYEDLEAEANELRDIKERLEKLVVKYMPIASPVEVALDCVQTVLAIEPKSTPEGSIGHRTAFMDGFKQGFEAANKLDPEALAAYLFDANH